MSSLRNCAVFTCLLAGGVVGGGCASTEMTESWTLPDYQPPLAKKVLVAAITHRKDYQRVFEREMKRDLKARGFQVERAADSLPDEARDMDRKELKTLIQSKSFDFVITVELRRMDKEARRKSAMFNPGTHSVNSQFLDFGLAYRSMARAGSIDVRRTFSLEVHLYDLARPEENLVWTAFSDTVQPTDIVEFAKDFADVATDRLLEDGVLRAR
jgi:hypothetical protein